MSAASATIFFAQGGENDRRQWADPFKGPHLVDKAADVRERLSRGDAETLISGAVRDADTKVEAAARDLVQISGAMRKIFGGAGVDRCDRGAEKDVLGSERQRRALRHVAEPARDVDAGETAPLDLARDVEGLKPPPRHGDEADCG
jgi:hypothetical protein